MTAEHRAPLLRRPLDRIVLADRVGLPAFRPIPAQVAQNTEQSVPLIPRNVRVERQDRPFEFFLPEVVAGVARVPEARALEAYRTGVPAVHLIRLIESAVVMRPRGMIVVHAFGRWRFACK